MSGVLIAAIIMYVGSQVSEDIAHLFKSMIFWFFLLPLTLIIGSTGIFGVLWFMIVWITSSIFEVFWIMMTSAIDIVIDFIRNIFK